jgi:hypothetical protein
MTDPLDSNIISLTLAWIIAILFCVPALAFALHPLEVAFERQLGNPRWLPWFWAYYILCLTVLSPLRYLMLQLLMAVCYIVQSFGAALHALIAATYFCLVMGGLYFVGIGLPSAVLLQVLKKDNTASRVASFVLTPILFAVGYALYFAVLPLAAWTIHWLPARDVIRSANGPAAVFYQVVVEPDIPRIGPRLLIQAGKTAKDRLRAHVVASYLSAFQRTKQHFTNSLRYKRQADEMLGKQNEDSLDTIPKDDLKKIAAAHKAALREARQVDCELLNTHLENLGTMYQEEYMTGLTDVIKGSEDADTAAATRGEVALEQWSTWYNEHRDAILAAL